MWKDFCTEVSIANFFVIAAEALMESTALREDQRMLSHSFANNFRFDHQTALECQTHARAFGKQYYEAIIAVDWAPDRSSVGRMQWIRADVSPHTL